MVLEHVLREFEHHLFSTKSFVYSRKSLQLKQENSNISIEQVCGMVGVLVAYLVFNIGLLVLIQMNFNQVRSIQSHSSSLAYNLRRIAQILQYCIVDSSQSSAVKIEIYIYLYLTTRPEVYPQPMPTNLYGLFCLYLLTTFGFGLGRIRLWATNTTCLPLNFFSSSRTSLVWIF